MDDRQWIARCFLSWPEGEASDESYASSSMTERGCGWWKWLVMVCSCCWKEAGPRRSKESRDKLIPPKAGERIMLVFSQRSWNFCSGSPTMKEGRFNVRAIDTYTRNIFCKHNAALQKWHSFGLPQKLPMRRGRVSAISTELAGSTVSDCSLARWFLWVRRRWWRNREPMMDDNWIRMARFTHGKMKLSINRKHSFRQSGFSSQRICMTTNSDNRWGVKVDFFLFVFGGYNINSYS